MAILNNSLILVGDVHLWLVNSNQGICVLTCKLDFSWLSKLSLWDTYDPNGTTEKFVGFGQDLNVVY